MRGKKRTKEERYELFQAIEQYLEMGFSLKKACEFADVPYSTVRDMMSIYEPLRARTSALQNTVNVQARQNIIDAIEQGSVKESKWWLERFDNLEPIIMTGYGGKSEAMLNFAETKTNVQEHRMGYEDLSIMELLKEQMKTM